MDTPAKKPDSTVIKQEVNESMPDEIIEGLIPPATIEIKKEQVDPTELNQFVPDHENFIGNNDPVNIKSEDVNTFVDKISDETSEQIMIGTGISSEDELNGPLMKGEVVVDMKVGNVKDESECTDSSSSSSSDDQTEESSDDKKNLDYTETSHEKRFKCNTCDYRCKLLKRMKLHSRTHKTQSELTTYPCTICKFRTKYSSSLQCHLKFVHNSNQQPKKYSCEKCSFRTNVATSLRNHQLRHFDVTDIFKCDQCRCEVKTQYLLDKHTTIVHNPPSKPQLKCSLCSYTTKAKCKITSHMTVHKEFSETTVYECELCSYKTKWSHCLRNHLKTHKSQQMPVHKCQRCDFEVNNKYSLQMHLKKHEEREKKFHKCNICDHSTISTSKLKNHMMTHKAPSERQWFFCAQCDYKSLSKLNLKRHLLLTHVDLNQFQAADDITDTH